MENDGNPFLSEKKLINLLTNILFICISLTHKIIAKIPLTIYIMDYGQSSIKLYESGMKISAFANKKDEETKMKLKKIGALLFIISLIVRALAALLVHILYLSSDISAWLVVLSALTSYVGLALFFVGLVKSPGGVKDKENTAPIRLEGQSLYFDSKAFAE